MANLFNADTNYNLSYQYYVPYGYKITELLVSNAGMVDMGTLNWNPIGNGCLYAAITGKANGRNIYCSKYPTDQSSMASATANMHIGGHDGNRVYFKNSSLENTRAAAQADLSGVYLYYQRTTDTTWTAPTTSTIYLPAPLQKVGNYTDSVESDGTLTRGVGILELDGVTNGKKVTDISTAMVASRHFYGFYGFLSSRAFKGFVGFRCTHFKSSAAASWPSANVNEIVTQGSQTSPSIFLTIAEDDTERNTVEGFNAWLAAQYAAGTPVTIYYPLATATTSTIAVPTISTAKGTNYIDTETEVKPSNMEVTYRKRTI